MMIHYNIEAEKTLIGSILLEPTIAKELIVKSDQCSGQHRGVFKAIEKVIEKNEQVDSGALFDILGDEIQITKLMEYTQAVVSPKFHTQQQKQIINAWRKGTIRLEAQKLIDQTNQAAHDEDIEAFLNNVSKLSLADPLEKEFSISDTLVEIYDEAESGKIDQGIMTDFSDYDELLNGHQDGQLIIIGARPSMGKTAFAINISNGHMKKGHFGHLYSLEMKSKAFVKRMMTAEGNLNNMKMRNPAKRFDSHDWHNFAQSMNVISKQNMDICDRSSIKVHEIYSRVKKKIKQFPDLKHFVMIDYLQLLQPTNKKSNRQEEVSEISRQLKIMADDLNIPVIVLSQLSRGLESRQDKRPMLSDLRESGSIEQDADVVAFLYRDDYYNHESENKNIIEIIVAKQREGPTGTVELAFIKEYNKFANISQYNYVQAQQSQK